MKDTKRFWVCSLARETFKKLPFSSSLEPRAQQHGAFYRYEESMEWTDVSKYIDTSYTLRTLL
jgi:hypothetical protein